MSELQRSGQGSQSERNVQEPRRLQQLEPTRWDHHSRDPQLCAFVSSFGAKWRNGSGMDATPGTQLRLTLGLGALLLGLPR